MSAIQSPEAERAVIGAVLFDSAALDAVSDRVSAEVFADPRHVTMWRGLQALVAASRPTDPVSLAQALDQAGELEDVGGLDYLVTVAQAAPLTTKVGYWSSRVALLAAKRRLLEQLAGLTQQIQSASPDDINALRDSAVETLLSAEDGGDSERAVDIKTAITEEVAEIKRRAEAPREVTGWPTGLIDLDRLTHGFEPTDLVTVGAATGHGKTMTMVQFAADGARETGTHALYVSVEVHATRIARRLLARYGQVNAEKLRTGMMSEQEVHGLTAGVAQGARLYRLLSVVFCRRGTVATVIREVRRYLSRRRGSESSLPPLGSVWVDYIQRLHAADKRYHSRENEVAEIARSLKDLAATYEIPVICAAQLNREQFKRANKRPQLSDLRESAALEHESSTVIFLHRPEKWDSGDRPGEAELILPKARDGREGLVTVGCQPEFQRLTNLERRWSE